MFKSGFRLLTIVTVLILAFTTCSRTDNVPENPFEAYLSEPHPAYSYDLVNTIEKDSYTLYVIRMISQEWLHEDITRNTEWWHWLTIVVPDQVDFNTAMLMIDGGNSNNSEPEEAHSIITEAALATNSVTAHIHNVPFQPLSFSDDRMDERYEDDIIAYGWSKFMEAGADDDDAEWLSRLPMTAAAKRAMDTVSDFTMTTLNMPVDHFVVTGRSKRGWTTWTSAIFDERVIAIAPAVIDLLNMLPSFEHHWRAYGEWSPAIRNYEDENFMDWHQSEEYARLRELVDPYSYRERLNLPKYIINAASDEFFLPDSWQFYWDDLPGDKKLRYIPNTGHSINETDYHIGLIAFYSSIINNQDLPHFSWDGSDNGFQIRYNPENPPTRLRLWNAHNPRDRDFRLYVIDRIWMSRDVTIESDGEMNIEINLPENGYTAWFVEAEFNTESGYPLKETTGVVVTPDTYPYSPFESANPLGTKIKAEVNE